MDGRISRCEWLILLSAISVGAGLAFHSGYLLTLSSAKQVFIYLVMAPLLEEYVFRAQLQRWIAERWSAPWFALVSSSCIFVICHMPWMGWSALGLLVPALVFGWYWLRFKSLWLNVGLHSASNFALALVTVTFHQLT